MSWPEARARCRHVLIAYASAESYDIAQGTWQPKPGAARFLDSEHLTLESVMAKVKVGTLTGYLLDVLPSVN
ncbi:MAG: hypothetical protein ACJ757_10370 [Gaiellaceae bacterium]